MVTISICSGKYIYNAEFVRDQTKNQIKIKNSVTGAVFWYFLNFIFPRELNIIGKRQLNNKTTHVSGFFYNWT